MVWGWKQAIGMQALATVPVYIFSRDTIIALCLYGPGARLRRQDTFGMGGVRKVWARFPVALTVRGWLRW